GSRTIRKRLRVFVRDDDVDQALRALKKKMQRESVFREMRRRKAYEKPSERKTREKTEAIRRARKAACKQAQREGLIPSPKRRLPRGPNCLTVKQFLARQRGGRRRKGGIRAAARALGLIRHRLGPHLPSAQHQRNHGTVQTQTSTTPHDQSGTQGTRHSGTGAGHHPDHQAADEDQTAVRTLR